MNSIKSKHLKNKRMLSALFFLTGCILLNMKENSPHHRLLSGVGNPYPPIQYGKELRSLSNYMGNGECEWIAPEKIEEENPMNTTTLLVSYPGSGKRLSWRVLEALTGSVTGDDWNLSQNGFKVLTLKTSYPHPEGVWAWGDGMDQSILLLRNPRAAIPSYHTLRYEINFSKSWMESFLRTNYTYTERPSVESWTTWRDRKVDREIDLWGRLIDFWMQDGLRRGPNNTTFQDLHCKYEMNPCKPKTIIQFEKLVSPDPQEGAVETDKISNVLENSPNYVHIIEPEGRACIHEKVLLRKEFYNANRDGHGPDPSLKRFEYWQINAMKHEAMRIRDNYTLPPWDTDPIAKSLVGIMEDYIVELHDEYIFEWTEWNNTYGED